MNKRITLQGISRTPGDRMTPEGGVAESINARLDSSLENVPQIMPERIDPFGGKDIPGRIVYIHDSGTYTNYVALSFRAIPPLPEEVWVVDIFHDGSWQQVWTPGNGDLEGVTSVGNTLIMRIGGDTYYFLYKDKTYKYLGNRIPEPTVWFKVKDAKSETINDDYDGQNAWYWLAHDSNADRSNPRISKEKYDSLRPKYGTSAIVPQADGEATVTDAVDRNGAWVWGKIADEVTNRRAEKRFCRPVFARSAIKLYDGSYVYASTPVLLGSSINKQFQYTYGDYIRYFDGTPREEQGRVNRIDLTSFKAERSVEYDYGEWSDIVNSVDIFLSEDVAFPAEGSLLDTATYSTKEEHGEIDTEIGTKATYTDLLTLLTFEYKQDKDLEEELLRRSNFYKVESIALDKLGLSYDQKVKTDTAFIEPLEQNVLVTKKALPSDFRSAHNPQPMSALWSYNRRVIGAGLKEELSRGYGYFQSPIPGENGYDYKFVYHIKADDGIDHQVVSHYLNGYSTEVFNKDENQIPGSLLMYPDTRCVAVDVYANEDNFEYGEIYHKRFDMKPHPNIEAAYFFTGDFNTWLIDLLEEKANLPSIVENPIVISPYKLLMSESENPFVYPAGGRLNMGSKVLGSATTTVALATGQYGQSELYIFTEEGVEAESITDTGSFGAHRFVSRDVALPGTICPIDQAIVFTSAKGVMLLTGGQVQCISDYMNGKPYELEEEIHDIISGYDWAVLSNAYEDTTPFMQFIQGAKYVYDYAGSRIICFRPDKYWQYVYQLDSQTWHKLDASALGFSFEGTLNSYPKALVSGKSGNARQIWDFSTYLNSDKTEDVPMLIVTRPLSFENPDVYKTLTRVRIRGDYDQFADDNSARVAYLLQGSDDGIHFNRLTSLRGKSWKWYRFIVVAKINPFERISWLDIEYEEKFNTKIR